ncbi:hypothetical protein D3C81_2303990 [compost metagenome]
MPGRLKLVDAVHGDAEHLAKGLVICFSGFDPIEEAIKAFWNVRPSILKPLQATEILHARHA